MITAVQTKAKFKEDPRWWKIALFDFVDDFRRTRSVDAIAESFELDDQRQDALFAAIIETLCDEMNLGIPEWISKIPGCSTPYFPSEMESLKAIAIVESPVRFRLRKIFVMENILHRV